MLVPPFTGTLSPQASQPIAAIPRLAEASRQQLAWLPGTAGQATAASFPLSHKFPETHLLPSAEDGDRAREERWDGTGPLLRTLVAMLMDLRSAEHPACLESSCALRCTEPGPVPGTASVQSPAPQAETLNKS